MMKLFLLPMFLWMAGVMIEVWRAVRVRSNQSRMLVERFADSCWSIFVRAVFMQQFQKAWHESKMNCHDVISITYVFLACVSHVDICW